MKALCTTLCGGEVGRRFYTSGRKAAEQLGVSEATARRSLARLAKSGCIQRTRKGRWRGPHAEPENSGYVMSGPAPLGQRV